MDCEGPLPVGQEVSAKFRGAFCEAVVRSSSNEVQVHVNFTDKSVSSRVVPLKELRGNVVLGGLVQGPTGSARGQFDDCVITRIVDKSVYEVEFDDGDLKNLKRNNIRPKGRAYFTNDTTIESLPLMDPEKFAALPTRASRASERSASTVSSSTRQRSRTVSASGVSSDTKSKGRPRISMTAPNSLSNLRANGLKDGEGLAVSRTVSIANVVSDAFKLRTTRLAGMAVFVEPLSNHSAPYWYTALVVPFACVDPVSMGVESLSSGNCVVRYFRDGVYGAVPEACLRRFSTEIPLFRLFCKQSRGFQNEPEIVAAIDFLETNKLDVSLRWPNFVPLKKRQADYHSDSEESEGRHSHEDESEAVDSDGDHLQAKRGRKAKGRKRRTESTSGTWSKKQCLDTRDTLVEGADTENMDGEDEDEYTVNREKTKPRVRRRKVPRRVSVSASAVDVDGRDGEKRAKKGCKYRGASERPVTPTPLEMEALYTNQWKFKKNAHVWAMSYVDGRVYEAKVTDRKLMSNARDRRRQQRAQASNSYRNQPTPHYKIHYIMWSTDRYDEWIQEEHVFDTNPDARPAVRARKQDSQVRAASVSSATSEESAKDTSTVDNPPALSKSVSSDSVDHDVDRKSESGDSENVISGAKEEKSVGVRVCLEDVTSDAESTIHEEDTIRRPGQDAGMGTGEKGASVAGSKFDRNSSEKRASTEGVRKAKNTERDPNTSQKVSANVKVEGTQGQLDVPSEACESLSDKEQMGHIATENNIGDTQDAASKGLGEVSMDEDTLPVRTPSKRRKRKYAEGTPKAQGKESSAQEVIPKGSNGVELAINTDTETAGAQTSASSYTTNPLVHEDTNDKYISPEMDDMTRSVIRRPRGRKGRKRGPRKTYVAVELTSPDSARLLGELVSTIDTQNSEADDVQDIVLGETRKRARFSPVGDDTAANASEKELSEGVCLSEVRGADDYSDIPVCGNSDPEVIREDAVRNPDANNLSAVENALESPFEAESLNSKNSAELDMAKSPSRDVPLELDIGQRIGKSKSITSPVTSKVEPVDAQLGVADNSSTHSEGDAEGMIDVKAGANSTLAKVVRTDSNVPALGTKSKTDWNFSLQIGSKQDTDDVAATANDVAAATDDVNAAVDDVTAATDDVIAATDDVTAPTDDVAAPTDDVTTPTDDVTAAADDVNAAVDDVTAPTDDVIAATDDATAPTDDATAATDDVTAPTDDVAAATDDVTTPTDDVTAAADDVTAPTDNLAATTDGIAAAADDVSRATDDVSIATEDVSTATDDVSTATDDVTSTTDDVAEATADVTTTTDDVAEATVDVTTTTDDVAEVTVDVPAATDDLSAATVDLPAATDDVAAATVDGQQYTNDDATQESVGLVSDDQRDNPTAREADVAVGVSVQKSKATASNQARAEDSESEHGSDTKNNIGRQGETCDGNVRRSRKTESAPDGEQCADGGEGRGEGREADEQKGASGSSYTVYTSTTTHKQEMGDGMTLTKEEFKVRHTLDTGGITISNQQIHEVKHTVEKSTIHPNLQWTADGGLEMSTLEERMRQLKQQYLAHKAELARRERMRRMKKENTLNANGQGTPTEASNGLPDSNSEEQNDNVSGPAHPKVENISSDKAHSIGTR
ncbi:hypothetical protein, variant [Sphaeroforma arctica JP610]|uniref:Methyl-accepting transducer domain-containing protein n=1 Tax=Sphaeroforma arctica JP610 TaxID=667725 RepID=A0A0L0FV76_9EUKA|nr:hypothetical protein, variant [Sphaeroforma arctica JP610]KNC80732.1 hypothetical protein, variant [Sphaeroforma arctica JP610]|eukprot:XP_014154634.1 hypothetical protein, variant [Sphaeroforma arctica JP610]